MGDPVEAIEDSREGVLHDVLGQSRIVGQEPGKSDGAQPLGLEEPSECFHRFLLPDL
jgi:hypothetical protein